MNKIFYRWIYCLIYVSAGLFFIPAVAQDLEEVVTVPDDYRTIQEAIDAIENDSSLSTTILIKPGIYTENLTLFSGITLKGEETARTFLASDDEGPIITLKTADGVTIRNLTFINADVAINVEVADSLLIASNVFETDSDSTAVIISGKSSGQIINNTFYQTATAIRRSNESSSIQIVNNIFANLEDQTIDASDDANISFNCFIDNNTVGSDAVHNGEIAFVNIDAHDFHLQQQTACIDEGTGTDAIDGSPADMGAYGGDYADVVPASVKITQALNVSAEQGVPAIQITWSPNLDYRVTNKDQPGGYKLYYDSDKPGEPYEGADAEGGTMKSPLEFRYQEGMTYSYLLKNLASFDFIPPAPVIETVRARNGTIELAWSAVANATTYRLHYGVADVNENILDLGKVTQHTLTGLTNDTTYTIAVSAMAVANYYLAMTAFDNVDQADEDDATLQSHESAYGDEVVVTLGEPRDSGLSMPVTAMPEAIEPYPNLPNEGCFIATAAYGFYADPQVQALRDFRDRYLLTNAVGRKFVAWYYTHSPPLAAYIARHTEWKILVQVLLLPFVVFAMFLTKLALPLQLAVMIVFSALLAWATVQRRKRQPLKVRT